MCYRPGHDTECCTGAIHKMMPLYVKRMWLQRGNEITATLYGPCSTSFGMENGEIVTINEATAYPFENQIEFFFTVSSPVNLTFQMRVPGWSRGYSLNLNGQVIRNSDESGCFICLKRIFNSGDKVVITFETEPVIQDRGKGMAIEYGALVFSLPIKAKKMIVIDDSNGKCSSEFPMYMLYPRSKWNYALSGNLTQDDIQVMVSSKVDYPWDLGQSPIKLEVGTARIVKNWSLKHHVVTSDIPDQPEIIGEEKKLQLEPLRSTLLRLTVFAKGDY